MIADLLLFVGSSFGLSLVVKTAAVAAAGLLLAAAARRARASLRHLLLAAAFAILAVLPPLAALMPAVIIDVPVAAAEQRTADPVRRDGVTVAMPRKVPLSRVIEQPWTLGRLLHAIQNWRSIDWLDSQLAATMWMIWAAGVFATLTPLVAGLVRVRRLRSEAAPSPALDNLARTLAADARIGRTAAVVSHERVQSPLTCGSRRPIIVLPANLEGWSDRDVTRAIVHELEHVRRHDWLVQVAARTVCAFYWFNPLVWAAWRRLCLEAERACDDAVLRTESGTEYAEQLVALARRQTAASPPLTLAMAHPSALSARVTALLDARRSRGPAAAWQVSGIIAAAAVTVVALAPMTASALAIHPSGTEERQAQTGVGRADRALYRAAERGDLERLARLLEAGANVNAALQGDGTPLIGAARAGKLEAVRLLLDRGADPNLPVRGDGTPLIMAAREGHAEVVALLLGRGADVNQIVDEDENALIQASANGHLAVVRQLIASRADVNARAWAEPAMERPQGEWRTALGMARRGGHNAVVAVLLSAGARE